GQLVRPDAAGGAEYAHAIDQTRREGGQSAEPGSRQGRLKIFAVCFSHYGNISHDDKRGLVMKHQTAVPPNIRGYKSAQVESDLVLHDLRLSALLGAAAWSRLPSAIRQRFGRRLDAGVSVTYAGEVVESRRTRSGKLLAQLC